MGWAYLDAAREAEPGQSWAFSHAGYRAMIAAAPAPVESACRNDGRCEYAVQAGAEKEGSCPVGKCAMPCDTAAAHLTIPGALEWDGDNGTHGVVGTHSADGESMANHSGDANEMVVPVVERQDNQEWSIDHSAGRPILTFKKCSVIEAEDAEYVLSLVMKDQNPPAPVSAYTAVDMATAAAGGFRDGQTAANDSLKAFANEMIAAAFEGGSFDGGDIQDIAVKHGLLRIERRNEACGEVCGCTEYGFPARCYRKTDLVKGGEQ